MQWIAMLTMLIDHIGAVWYEDLIILRIIGRLAFPIYAFYVVQGMQYTSNRKRYVWRLGILALLSQAPFSLLFETYTVNVIGTFFVCVLGLYGFYQERFAVWQRYASLLLCATLLITVQFDYGIYALLLMLIYRYASGMQIFLYHLALNMFYVFSGMTSNIQIWSLLPSIVFTVPQGRAVNVLHRWRSPKLLWRVFYPGHLIALYVWQWTVGIPSI